MNRKEPREKSAMTSAKKRSWEKDGAVQDLAVLNEECYVYGYMKVVLCVCHFYAVEYCTCP